MATVTPQPISTGRWSEAGLLLLAVALGVSGYLLVGVNIEGAVPSELLPMAGTLAGIALVAHLVLRWRAPYADPVLLPLALGLNGVGLAMIYRIDYATGDAAGPRQLIWTALGAALAVTIVIALRDHRQLRRFTYTSLVVSLLLLLLPMIPGLGQEINGAQLWIRIAGFSFQPAEIAKITLAIFFAGHLVAHRDVLTLAGPKILGLQLPRVGDMGPILLAWVASVAVLVFQRDLGTSLLFFGLFVAMLYVATDRFSWIVIGLGMFAVGVLVAVNTFGHVAARFDVWLNALDPAVYNRHPGGSGQVVQGLFGLASGGLMGTGWGEGYPDLVPYSNSDFIIASLGEELGLTGLLAILLCYLVLVQRALRTSIGVRDGFGKLLASGLGFAIAFQCFVVVGGVTRLIPLTGLTMPFLAAGGSAMIANWIVLGLLLRISDGARRPAAVDREVSDETVLSMMPVAGTGAGDVDSSAGAPRGGRARAPGDGADDGDDHPTEVVQRP
ncbi:FtsW/RodA/SpoVE family cell cycle protein [Pseudactinotalea sp. Z1739]|uniref:FtsW/RodA/SpoVE family cell cycle protein n=1 Tax=Pseudactinotalea sp. Z1739 TaxID=3413028 RepID=UPI003C7B61D6